MGKKYLSTGNRSGAGMGYILLTLVVSLSILMTSNPGFGTTLDKKGQVFASCSAGILASHIFAPGQNTYTFSGQCVESSGNSVTNRLYNANASWTVNNKTAKEVLSVTFVFGLLTGAFLTPAPMTPGSIPWTVRSPTRREIFLTIFNPEKPQSPPLSSIRLQNNY